MSQRLGESLSRLSLVTDAISSLDGDEAESKFVNFQLRIFHFL